MEAPSKEEDDDGEEEDADSTLITYTNTQTRPFSQRPPTRA